MTALNLYNSIALTVAFCLGWRTVTSEGQLLYFIRKFFEDRIDNKAFEFIGKPFVLCITCMASIWGVIIYTLLNEFSLVECIVSCVSSSFIQTYIYKKYVKLDRENNA
jgi:hypothetical protein